MDFNEFRRRINEKHARELAALEILRGTIEDLGEAEFQKVTGISLRLPAIESIHNCLRKHPSTWLTASQIGKHVGLSASTVGAILRHRYDTIVRHHGPKGRLEYKLSWAGQQIEAKHERQN